MFILRKFRYSYNCFPFASKFIYEEEAFWKQDKISRNIWLRPHYYLSRESDIQAFFLFNYVHQTAMMPYLNEDTNLTCFVNFLQYFNSWQTKIEISSTISLFNWLIRKWTKSGSETNQNTESGAQWERLEQGEEKDPKRKIISPWRRHRDHIDISRRPRRKNENSNKINVDHVCR